MAQTEQQEMKHHRSLNATTCNFVVLTEYLWKMEKKKKHSQNLHAYSQWQMAVYFYTLWPDLVLALDSDMSFVCCFALLFVIIQN